MAGLARAGERVRHIVGGVMIGSLSRRVDRLAVIYGLAGRGKVDRMTWDELEEALAVWPDDPVLMAEYVSRLEQLSDLELHLRVYGPGVPLGLPHEEGV